MLQRRIMMFVFHCSHLPFLFGLDNPAVTGIATRSLGLANNLDNLTTAQTKVASNRIRDLYTGQLGLLQTVALKELGLLLGAEQNMLGNQFVAGDVNKKILFLEVLADAAWDTGKKAHGRGRDRGLRDEDAGVEVVLINQMVEGAHLLGSDTRGIGAEVDVDCAAVGLGVWVCFAGQWCVLHLHGLSGASLDFHLGAAVVAISTVSNVNFLYDWIDSHFLAPVSNAAELWGNGRRGFAYSG